MNYKKEIIRLRDEIAQRENDLEKMQEAYMTEAMESGVVSEEFGGFGFFIQTNPPKLDLHKTGVPEHLHKLTIDQTAVRKFLMEHGTQPWGALMDDKPYKLMVKKIKPSESTL